MMENPNIGNYEWVDPHEYHECAELKKMKLVGIKVRKWKSGSGGADLEIETCYTAVPINFCPYCGKNLK